jgi:hypothetical protein
VARSKMRPHGAELRPRTAVQPLHYARLVSFGSLELESFARFENLSVNFYPILKIFTTMSVSEMTCGAIAW